MSEYQYYEFLAIERELKNEDYAWVRILSGGSSAEDLRTVKEIRENADSAQKMRLEQERLKRKRQEEKRRQKRQAHLKCFCTGRKRWP